MAHYAAIHKETGELMWTQNPQTLGPEWDCKRVSRAPTEFDEYDRETGRLKQNPGRKAAAERNKMTLPERVAQLEAQVIFLLSQNKPKE